MAAHVLERSTAAGFAAQVSHVQDHHEELAAQIPAARQAALVRIVLSLIMPVTTVKLDAHVSAHLIAAEFVAQPVFAQVRHDHQMVAIPAALRLAHKKSTYAKKLGQVQPFFMRALPLTTLASSNS